MLRITNKESISGFLRVEDLEDGQLFSFLDDDNVFMKTDYDAKYVNLETGILHEYYNTNAEERPVKKIFGELKLN